MAIIVPSDYSLSYTAKIAPNAIQEARAKTVAAQHLNTYDLNGDATGAIALSRFSDIGTADTVALGTEYNTESAFGSTAVTLTPTRKAKAGQIDKETARRRVVAAGLGGPSIEGVVQTMTMPVPPGTPAAAVNQIVDVAVAAFGIETGQLIRAHMETVEDSVIELFSSLSRSVGTSTANLTVDQFEDGLFTLENGETLPHENIVAQLDIRQVYDLRIDIRTETGTAFISDLATILAVRPDIARNGLKGALLGVPVYQHSAEVRVTANAGADVVGALFLAGQGDPEVSGSGLPGCFAFAQLHGPQIAIRYEPNAFGPRIVVDWPWIVGERVDNWGVAVITDAP